MIIASFSLQIKISFVAFHLENCRDFVTIYNGSDSNKELIFSHTGDSIPEDLYVKSKSVYIQFTSARQEGLTGFEINLVFVGECFK